MKVHYLLLLLSIAVACRPVASGTAETDVVPHSSSSKQHHLVDSYYKLTALTSGRLMGSDSERLYFSIGYQKESLSVAERNDFYKQTGEDKTSNDFAYGLTMGPTSALINRIQQIEITCNEVFNGVPAGQSLSHFFKFYSASAWPIIQIGHDSLTEVKSTEYYSLFGDYPFGQRFSPISKRVSDLTPEDLFLLTCQSDISAVFLLTAQYPETKTFTFTVTYREGESQWSVDVPME